jgi:hypothetical protein
MHGIKVLAVVLVVGVLALLALFLLVPGSRPGFVQAWFRSARGYTPAKSAEDALAKFKKAIEERDYETAALYCTGPYQEWIAKGAKEARDLGLMVDNLKSVMKSTGVKSDKANLVLFWLDPFPSGFRIENVQAGADKATAVLNWTEEVYFHASQAQSVGDWRVDVSMHNTLLPLRLVPMAGIPVEVVADKDKSWKVVLPVEVVGGRHMRYPIESLLKNGSNFKNAIAEVKNDVKNNPTTKENFEQALKTKLEESK